MLAAVVVAVVILIYGGYGHHWPWTGINGKTATLWDWLHLLLLPFAVVILPIWLKRRAALGSRHKAAGVTMLTAFVLVVLFGYLTPWTWTGFTGNTLWDWLGLLALPLAVALIPVVREVHARWRQRDLLIVIGGLLLFLVPVLGGYLGGWKWTGFRGNTLWDWLHLLILPLLVPAVVVPALKPFATPESPPAPESRKPRPESETAPSPAEPRRSPPPGTRNLSGSKPVRQQNRALANRRWLAVAAGLSAVVIAAGVVLATQLATSRSPSVKQDVRHLNAIVQQFIAGKRLSQAQNRYADAAQNRLMVLERLGTLRLPSQLGGAAATLREMTADSLAYNLLMAKGLSTQAQAPNAAHDALRPRFVSQFNPYAQRYLGLTYQAGEL